MPKYGKVPKTPAAKAKIHKVMSEFAGGSLASGSGQKVSSRKQALAIALNQARKKR